MANLDYSSRQVLNSILGGQELKISFVSAADYNSARVSLLKMFKQKVDQFESLDIPNPWEGKFIKATFNKTDVVGTFRLEEDHRKTNIRGRIYSVVETKDL